MTITPPRDEPPARPRPAAPRAARRPRAAAPDPGATERIVAWITEAIVERRRRPGAKLAEQRLADHFQVSRTLVRQALNRLSVDKLVTLEPARGARVAAPGLDEARQVFEAREMIEVALVQRLAAAITPAQVAQLRAHLVAEQASVRRRDVGGRTRRLADFHVLLAQMLGNDPLVEIVGDLLSRCSLVALMVQSGPSAQHSSDDHVAIVDALERHDGRSAARLMARHLAQVEHHLRIEAPQPAPAAAEREAAPAPSTPPAVAALPLPRTRRREDRR